MSNFGESTIVSPLAAFGEVAVAVPTPITQINAVYGFNNKMATFVGPSGTAEVNSPLFECTSGTDPNGFGSLTTSRQVTYRAGQGLLARFSALFGTPVADSRQHAGLFSNTDSLGFGFDGVTFGVIHEHSGFSEIQTLTVTTPSVGAENATVTVDGTGYTVPLTAGTVEHNAYEISNSLNSQVPLYDFSSNGATVVARSLLATPGGAFAFTSGTAIGAWVQDSLGVVSIRDFTPQASWNVDTMPDLDPLLGNVYQIQLQWLGFGAITFFVEDPTTGRERLVHRIEYPNSATAPSLSSPTMRVGWIAGNNGSVTSVTVKGASAGGFVEGQIVRTESPRSLNSNNAAVGITEINLLTVRSRLVYGNRRNRVETFSERLSFATESAKTAIIAMYLNATVSGDLDYQYVDEDESIIEYATDAGVVTGGKLVASVVLPNSGGIELAAKGLIPLLQPGETYTIAARLSAAPAALVGVGFTWQEDL